MGDQKKKKNNKKENECLWTKTPLLFLGGRRFVLKKGKKYRPDQNISFVADHRRVIERPIHLSELNCEGEFLGPPPTPFSFHTPTKFLIEYLLK
jgi:hypothetical protein